MNVDKLIKDTEILYPKYVPSYKPGIELITPIIFKGIVKQTPAFYKWTIDRVLSLNSESKIFYTRYDPFIKAQYWQQCLINSYESNANEILSRIKNNQFQNYAIEESDAIFADNDILFQELTENNPFISESDIKSYNPSFWYAPNNRVVDLHVDYTSLVLFQLQGEKTVRLIPPEQKKYLKTVPEEKVSKFCRHLNFDPIHYAHEVKHTQWCEFKCFESDKSDSERNIQGYQVKLAPGDAILIPDKWWHATINHSSSLASNVFFLKDKVDWNKIDKFYE